MKSYDKSLAAFSLEQCTFELKVNCGNRLVILEWKEHIELKNNIR
ncbi:28193_t:CDS:2 [Gigaspora margarita]|uniref:28193_t:CDS:1 n=1 Tax=Gigaspora margarita TaxID=4874 RepID=A0ABN7UXV5_GIGMA|nr:28193_t:CDS:2 [Gigaspora margarita]